MNFVEFNGAVPEGFHDAKLLRIEEDFGASTIRLLVNFCWRGPDDPVKKPERKLGWVTLVGVQRWVWKFHTIYSWGGAVQIDGGEADAETLNEYGDVYAALNGDLLKGWLFVHDWTALVCWAASRIDLEFVER